MKETTRTNQMFSNIDWLQLVKAVWNRIWIVILFSIICAAFAFTYATYFITPMYSSNVRLYVNGSSINVGSASLNFSASELSTSKSVLPIYIAILSDYTTLEQVAEESELPYSAGQLGGMISASSVGDTAIMRVNVTAPDPYDAASIANCIATVLQERIESIIRGTSLSVVGYARPQLAKISPNITKYTEIGFAVGAIITILIIAAITFFDNTIHDEDYLIQSEDFPLLAKVPDLFGNTKKYGKYYKHGRYYSYDGYGYGYGYGHNRKSSKIQTPDEENKQEEKTK